MTENKQVLPLLDHTLQQHNTPVCVSHSYHMLIFPLQWMSEYTATQVFLVFLVSHVYIVYVVLNTS